MQFFSSCFGLKLISMCVAGRVRLGQSNLLQVHFANRAFAGRSIGFVAFALHRSGEFFLGSYDIFGISLVCFSLFFIAGACCQNEKKRGDE
jgi:hypothetical protein